MMYNLAKSLMLLAAKESAWATRLLQSRSARPFEPSSEAWREAYARDEWKHLWDVSELGHYSVITGYFARFAPGGAVLDVGCGEGVLQQCLVPHDYRRYLGVDFAPEAIQRARPSADARTVFEAADAAAYVPNGTFDAIIFNEVLYSFGEPMTVMQRYRAYLAASGVFIVSTHVSRRNLKIPHEVRTRHRIEDEVSVVNRQGTAWLIQVARPRD